jgi:hypothetical protein
MSQSTLEVFSILWMQARKSDFVEVFVSGSVAKAPFGAKIIRVFRVAQSSCDQSTRVGVDKLRPYSE